MNDLSSSWNPLKKEDANLNDKFFTAEDFKSISKNCKNDFNENVFRKLCATAIGLGAISTQDFIRKFGEVIPRDVNTNNTTWCIPKPNVTRDILSLFSTFDEEQFTGAPIPWHHKAEDSSSPKPNA